jgi:hypothetical protein
VDGKLGEHLVAKRAQILENLLPGILSELKRIGTADSKLCGEEVAYAQHNLPNHLRHAVLEIDRTSQSAMAWTEREDVLLLKKCLFDTEESTTMQIPGHTGKHAARRRLEQLRSLSPVITKSVPIRIRALQHATSHNQSAAAFPWLLSNSHNPMSQLTVSEWSPIRHQPLCLPGPVLPGAEISFAHASARIPAKWTLQLNEQRFVLANAPHGDDAPPDPDHWSTYTLDDVQPTSTAAEIAQNIASWLRWQGIKISSSPIRLVHVKGRDLTPQNLEEWVPSMTAAEFNIYSKHSRLIITTLATADGSRDGYDLWGNRTNAATAAYNARPNAPPHIEMVNNLLPVPVDGELQSNADFLDESREHRKQLKKFLKSICVKPHCICFQCGYICTPRPPRRSSSKG